MPLTDAASECPHCGYDLRMIESERCPECGEPIDRAAIAQSRIPWALRKHRGSVRGYLQTVWMVTLGTQRLADEIHRPTGFRDARRFWFLTSLMVSIPFVVLFVGTWLTEGYVTTELPRVDPFDSTRSKEVLAFHYDVLYPWRLGVQLAWLMPFWIFLAVLTNLGMPSYLLDRRHHAERRGRAIALSYYTSGALFGCAVFGLAAAGFATVSMFADEPVDASETIGPVVAWIALAFIVLYWWRVASLVRRLNPGRFLEWAIAFFGLPVLWLLNWGFWLLGVPWLLGYAWILFWTW